MPDWHDDNQKSVVLNVAIACAYDEAAAFLFNPANIVQWAAGLGQTLKKTPDGWVVETPAGSWPVRFTSANDLGVLDHWVSLPTGTVYVPMRIVRNGDGCDVAITLLRHPAMDDAAFARDRSLIKTDLQSLKTILEH